MENNVKISLPINAWNIVLTALGQRPYLEVSDLVDDIRKQAQPQIQEIQSNTDTNEEAK